MEVGETVEEAVVRETREETGIDVRALDVVAVTDYIEKESDRVRWQYVLIDVLCAYVGGEPFPASDADNARFVETRELTQLDIARTALDVLGAASVARNPGAGPD